MESLLSDAASELFPEEKQFRGKATMFNKVMKQIAERSFMPLVRALYSHLDTGAMASGNKVVRIKKKGGGWTIRSTSREDLAKTNKSFGSLSDIKSGIDKQYKYKHIKGNSAYYPAVIQKKYNIWQKSFDAMRGFNIQKTRDLLEKAIERRLKTYRKKINKRIK